MIAVLLVLTSILRVCEMVEAQKGGEGASKVSLNVLDKAILSAPAQMSPASLNICGASGFCSSENDIQKIVWNPQPGKYLLAFCMAFQFSNHIVCLRKQMLLAAALQRTLIIPEISFSSYAFNFSSVFDIFHATICLGRMRVISLNDYHKKMAAPLEVDFYCWTRLGCGCEPEYEDRLQRDSIIKKTCRDTTLPTDLSKAQFLDSFYKLNEKVICVGDLFFNRFTDNNYLGNLVDTSFGMSGWCKAVFRPPLKLIIAAKTFAREFLGHNFISVHFRRGDFYDHCLRYRFESCFPSASQTAICLAGTIQNLISIRNYTTVFIASNGEPDEMSFFKESLHNLIKWQNFRVVHFGSMPQLQNFLESKGIVDEAQRITFMKLVLAMGHLFFGSMTSTFSDDVVNMRHGLNRLTPDDGYCSKFNKDFPGFTFIE